MKSESNEKAAFDLLNPANVEFTEGLYVRYLKDPESVGAAWREYFDSQPDGPDSGHLTLDGLKQGPSFQTRNVFSGLPSHVHASNGEAKGLDADTSRIAVLQDRINQLIRNYRVRGHLKANLDPLGLRNFDPPELDIKSYGFSESDLDRSVTCENFTVEGHLTIRELHQHLVNTYCRSIGVQYMHINDVSVRRWLQQRMEGCENRVHLARQEQLRILTRLTDAEVFEEFVQKKFVGAKTFSLEGAESLIPLLDLAIEKAGDQGIREIVMGMAHRGRLNVLANILQKSPREIFREFADKDPELFEGRGDVKYHLGYSSDWTTVAGKRVHLSLCFNPSHLEYVNPVVLGRVRAKQDRIHDASKSKTMALIIHGDAAFSGEGVVQETLNLSQLKGYSVGGTLHVIVNNQIGFTTSPEDGRSSVYATLIAKMLEIPVFHVNGEDPEAVAQVIRLAMDFRKHFQRDVVVDMYCYRRLGHNEADEPSFTQPVLYKAIKQRTSVHDGYLDHLLELGEVTREEAGEIEEQRREHLEEMLAEARSEHYQHQPPMLTGIWRRSDFSGGKDHEIPDVAEIHDADTLADFLRRQTVLPETFRAHPKILKFLEGRAKMAEGEKALDWAASEAMAFAACCVDRVTVRLSGQDSERGTFSHRHVVFHDFETGEEYVPLNHVSKDQSPFYVYNSPLSEAGVLGFDYGYSLDCPDGLVMWEAQFGDFANSAQVIIDQFITSAEDKWRRLSGIVMLLPHGFEGQGPEHSSARIERFLNLAAEDNIQVIQPSSPAQYFHALRRQVLRQIRKPLIVMTPKSLLRNSRAVSSLAECASGSFKRVISDPEVAHEKVTRVLLCSGKVYYELMEEREKRERDDVAIVRLEQYYPLPQTELMEVLQEYRQGTELVWVQEEPENMGAWYFLRIKLGEGITDNWPLRGVYRVESSSPATGSASAHRNEQARLMESAFA